MGSSKTPFLSIEDARVTHLGREIFQNLNFVMLEGQSWAILGNSGMEMTAFLDTLQGKTTLRNGKVSRDFAVSYQEQKRQEGEIYSFRDLISFVSQKYEFRNKSNLQDFYYQQRFNASESEEALTVESFLLSRKSGLPGKWDLHSVLPLLRLDTLKDKSLIKLSNGETRRLSLAAALIKNPRLLLLDQPMTGLDVASRKEFGNWLAEITHSGIQVIMTTRAGEIPGSVTHVGVLENGKFRHLMKSQDFHGVDFNKDSHQEEVFERLAVLIKDYPLPEFRELVSMKDVRIRYGEKVILDQFSWVLRQGERWALKGPNGAGKSTLLSLIFGENPQAYANNIVLFDKKRGSGESIWDVKKPTGFVAAELSRYFPKSQSCLQVVLSGYFDTIGLFRKASPEQIAQASAWLEVWGLGHIADTGFHRVSLENQRFCLLARAMIKSPSLLILDEATQGMDEAQADLFRDSVDWIALHTPISMIYVSHYDSDIPS
ncbi:MAG TPA: ATP-binding cassette domain-containing protein, partial [Cyclobacteriaceae bacterium]|nr:ATP-binding cassette domain-containing protein [Cyclobacteriaceae bacterium]